MAESKTVLVIGEIPELQDFSDPAIPPGLDAGKVRAALETDQEKLRQAGFEPELLLTDAGETAVEVVADRLRAKPFDCVVIGAGIRIVPRHFELFERLVNVVHEHAPAARIAFNTGPDNSSDAAARWL